MALNNLRVQCVWCSVLYMVWRARGCTPQADHDVLSTQYAVRSTIAHEQHRDSSERWIHVDATFDFTQADVQLTMLLMFTRRVGGVAAASV